MSRSIQAFFLFASIERTSTDMATNIVEQHLKDKAWIDNPEILPWYVKDLVDLHPKTKELFETYSKVPSDEVVSHITDIRNKAFKIVSLQPDEHRTRSNQRTSSHILALDIGDF